MAKGFTEPREVFCPLCNCRFFTRRPQTKYCSSDCSRAAERASWRAYGARNREARRAYQSAHYAKAPEVKAAKVRAYLATPEGRAMQRVNGARQRAKFPEKYQARQAVLIAMRAGKLVRTPCEKCGGQKTQAHHVDYSKPLEVQWLCEPCHRQAHRKDDNENSHL